MSTAVFFTFVAILLFFVAWFAGIAVTPDAPSVVDWAMERWKQSFGASEYSFWAFSILFSLISIILPSLSILYIGLKLSQLLG